MQFGVMTLCCSFTGNREDPLVVDGVPVYMRGLANLLAYLSMLTQSYKLADATEVLLSGCSAGGI